MPEILDERYNNPPHMFVISAITNGKKIDEVLAAANGPHQVQLLVNGVEVPFYATIDDWWDRCNKELDRRAAELVMKKFTGLGDFLEDVRHQIKQRVEDAFDVTLDDE